MAKTIEATVTKPKPPKPNRQAVWEVWWYDADGGTWDCLEEHNTAQEARDVAVACLDEARVVHFVLE